MKVPHRSWPLWLTNRRIGRTMDFEGDDIFIGSLRCRRGDEFRSIGPSPDLAQPNPEPPTYVMKFCPVEGHQEMLVLANEDGKVAFQNTSHPRLKSGRFSGFMTGLSAHANAIFDLSWAPRQAEKIVTVSGDQTAKLWDLSSATELRCIRTFRGHQRSVKVAEFQPGSDDVFATASRDNTICIWDSRDKSDNCQNVIRQAHKPHASRKSGSKFSSPMATTSSVTAIKFQDDNLLISCGDKDGVVKVWDLRRSYSLYSKDPVARSQFLHPGSSSKHGFTSLALDSGLRYVYASCMDNKIYQFDLVTCDEHPTKQFLGCDFSNFYVRISLSHDNRYLVSGSSNANAYVWNTRSVCQLQGETPSQLPIAALEGHSAEVTCVDWCRSQWRLATCGDDMRHRIWEMDRDNVEKEDICGEAVMSSAAGAEAKLTLIRNHLSSSTATECFLNQEKNGLNSSSTCKVKRVSSSSVAAFCPMQRGIKRSFTESTNKMQYTATTRVPLSENVGHTSPVKSTLKIQNLPCSPNKMSVVSSKGSPRKLSLFSSPTSNLPSFVRDGGSPTVKTGERSIPKKSSDNWLDALRQKKKESMTKENLMTRPAKKSRRNIK